jgi:hypothetical protein
MDKFLLGAYAVVVAVVHWRARKRVVETPKKEKEKLWLDTVKYCPCPIVNAVEVMHVSVQTDSHGTFWCYFTG